MLSNTKIKEILRNKKIKEEEIDRMRNEMYALAEIFFEEISPEGGSKKHSWVIDSTIDNNGN